MPATQSPSQGCFHSNLFGLEVRSVLALPMSSSTGGEPDVDVVYDHVPEQLNGATACGLRYQARPGQLLITVDGVARYLICEGRRIIIERASGADDDDVRLFLLGSALGALLHQRHAVVLHGSAVVLAGRAVAFVGPSGIGKSTLAMAFGQRGAQVLTDDLCVVWPSRSSGQMLIEPGFGESKLWLDSLRELDIAADELPRIRSSLEKRKCSLGSARARHAVPLQRVYVLRAANDVPLSITEVHGPQKFALLKQQTYREVFVDGLGVRPDHFSNTLLLAQQVSVAILERPHGAFVLDEMMARVTADLA